MSFKLSTMWCVVLAIIFLAFVTNHAEAAGKCLPFNDYDLDKQRSTFFYYGAHRPVCFSLLKDSYDHYWADDEVIQRTNWNPQNPLDETCLLDTQFVIDETVRSFVLMYGSEQPTSLCQKMLTLAMCMQMYPRCDPQEDNQGTHVTKDRSDFKPCKWFCELFSSEGVCTADDFKHFELYGLDFTNPAQLTQYLPQFDCTNRDRWSEDNKCLIMSNVQLHRPAHRCETYTGDICRGLFGSSHQVYIDPAWQQEELEQIIKDQTFIFNGLPEDSDCSFELYRSLCTVVFPDCLSAKMTLRTVGKPDIRVVNSIQLRPPLNLCNRLTTSCAEEELFAHITQSTGGISPFPDCVEGSSMQKVRCVKNSTGMPNFLDRYKTVSLSYASANSDITGVVQLSAGSDFNYVSDVPYPAECPKPLVLADNPNTPTPAIFEGRCYRPCVSGALSASERERIMTVTNVMSIIVMVCTLLLALSFVVFKSQRHKQLMFYYSMSYFCVPLLIFIGMRVTPDYEAMCHNNTDRRHFEGFALFQAMGLVYFFVAHACWWLMSALDLFLRLIVGRSYKRGSVAYNRRNVAMHLFCWGVPALCVSALLVGKFLGYDGNLPFALTSSDPTAKSDLIDLFWFFVFAPVLACAGIGLVFVAIIFWFLMRYSTDHITTPVATPYQPAPHLHNSIINTNADGTQQPQQPLTEEQMQRNMQNQLQQHIDTADDYKPTQEMEKFQNSLNTGRGIRFKVFQSFKLFGFVFLMFVTIGIVLGYCLYRISLQGQWENDLKLYERCLVTAMRPETCKLASRMNPDVIIVGLFVYISPGILMFILYFLLTNDLWRLWIGLLHYRLGLTIFSTFALEDTTDGTGSSAGSSSGKSSSGGSNGSSDILTGDNFNLRKKKNKNGNSTEGGTQDSDTIETLTIDTQNRDAAQSIVSPSDPKRRKTLFKGLKTADHRYGTSKHAAAMQMLVRSKMSQDDALDSHAIPEADERDDHNDDDDDDMPISPPNNFSAMASPSHQPSIEMTTFDNQPSNNQLSPQPVNSPSNPNNNYPDVQEEDDANSAAY